MVFRKILSFCFLYIFLSFYLSAQDKKVIQEDLFKRFIKEHQIRLSGGNPDSLLLNFRKLREDAKKIGHPGVILACTFEIMELLLHSKGDFIQLIEESKIGEQVAIEHKYYGPLIQIYQIRSLAYYDEGFMNLGLRQSEETLKYTDRVSNISDRNVILADTYINIAQYYAFKKDNKTRLKFLHKSQDAIKNVADTSDHLKLVKKNVTATQLELLGNMYQEQKQLDSAEFYYLAAYKLYNDKRIALPLFNETELLINLSHFNYRQKKYRNAINFAHLALNLKKDYSKPFNKRDIYQILYKSYIEINKTDSSKYFSTLFSKIDDSIAVDKKSNLNSFFEKKVSQDKSDYHQNIKSIIVVVSLILIILILLIWYWVRISRARIHQKYQSLITKLSQKITEKERIESVDKEPTLSKSGTDIIDQTVIFLVKKLEKFEKSNKFTKKDLTLTSLAHDLGTNTRYISEIIKEYRGQNFNAYINTLRIQFITQKLYDEPQFRNYKIAYLAEASGFSSREVFATIFKRETGVTPSYFINQLLKSDESTVR